MHANDRTEAGARRLIGHLKAFDRWEQRPLTRQLKQMLSSLDEQTLLSLTAQAVQQVEYGPPPTRHLPI